MDVLTAPFYPSLLFLPIQDRIDQAAPLLAAIGSRESPEDSLPRSAGLPPPPPPTLVPPYIIPPTTPPITHGCVTAFCQVRSSPYTQYAERLHHYAVVIASCSPIHRVPSGYVGDADTP
jgi:hypothetical protein